MGWKSTGDLYIEMLEQREWEGLDPYETDDGIELDLREYLAALADRLPKDE